MPASLKNLGTAVPALAVMALLCWLYLLWSIAHWIAKTPVPGRESDKYMPQVFSGGLVVVLWLLVGGLLVLAGAKAAMPPAVGIASWILHPASCLFALVAIAVMYDAEWRWALVVPAAVPALVAAYALSVLFMADRPSPAAWGLIMWAAVLALCLAVVPPAIRFQAKHLPRGESVEARPGPELDQFMARERARQRQRGLDEIHNADDETKLVELEPWARDGSPVRDEALAAMRKLPNRQHDAEIGLWGDYSWILPYLAQIDVQPTPELCSAAKHYLQTCIREVRNWPEPGESMGRTLESGIHGIEWIAKNCDCAKELQELDDLAGKQKDTPDVRDFRAALKAFRK